MFGSASTSSTRCGEPHLVVDDAHVPVGADRRASGRACAPRRPPPPCGPSSGRTRSSRSRATRSTTLMLGGLVGGDRDALAHRLRRPLDVAPALARDRLAERRGEVLHLLPHASRGCPRPCPPTGCAAPMLVPGAIAATCAAIVTKTPAEPAHGAARRDVDDRPAAARRGCPSPPRAPTAAARRGCRAGSRGRRCPRPRARAIASPHVLRRRPGLIAAVDHDARQPGRRSRAVPARPASSSARRERGDGTAVRRAHGRASGHARARSITCWMSCHTSRLSAGLRSRYAGWNVGISWMPW